MKLSIVVVNYKVDKELVLCIDSIVKSKPKISYEIIVVDNSEEGKIEKEIKLKFSNVLYIKSSKNKGYGAGNNLGAKFAKGKYLFFLNPDTTIRKKAIDELIKFIEEEKNIGIVAPILLGKDGKAYQQGSRDLGLLQGIICLSFLNKLFPQNPVSQRYFLSDWNREIIKEVDVVPGTAFIIEKNLFNRIGKFDENLFLYFEEFDLCKRLKKTGYRLFINPSAQIFHVGGASTIQRKDAKKIFEKSRFYYFRKYFGIIPALLVHMIDSFGKVHLFLLAFLLFMGIIILAAVKI